MKEVFEKALENAKIHISNLFLEKELNWEEIEYSIEKLKKYEEKIKNSK